MPAFRPSPKPVVRVRICSLTGGRRSGPPAVALLTVKALAALPLLVEIEVITVA